LNLFNIIKNKQEYWLVDQIKKKQVSNEEYLRQLTQLLDEWKQQKVGYLSLLMDENAENRLLDKGFTKISSIVEYTRNLDDLPELDDQIEWHSLSEGSMTDQEYGVLYERCRSGSANKNKKQTIAQVMTSLKNELGPDWRDHCIYFEKDDVVIGIGIPHIEMGTEDEGRLFYFGVVPEMRGHGIGTKIHKLTLSLLKKWNAIDYVGSTDIHNKHMIKIFERNGCKLRYQKGIYRIQQINL
jgi:GNAT superfamily N-acetyltransferase